MHSNSELFTILLFIINSIQQNLIVVSQIPQILLVILKKIKVLNGPTKAYLLHIDMGWALWTPRDSLIWGDEYIWLLVFSLWPILFGIFDKWCVKSQTVSSSDTILFVWAKASSDRIFYSTSDSLDICHLFANCQIGSATFSRCHAK